MGITKSDVTLGYPGTSSYACSRINDRDYFNTNHILVVRCFIYSFAYS